MREQTQRNKNHDKNKYTEKGQQSQTGILFPRFIAERVLWIVQGVIIVLTLESIFELATVINLHLLSAYDSQVHLRDERLASLEELMCLTCQRCSNCKDHCDLVMNQHPNSERCLHLLDEGAARTEAPAIVYDSVYTFCRRKMPFIFKLPNLKIEFNLLEFSCSFLPVTAID